MRENIIHAESNKYYSIELRGPILPTALHAVAGALRTAAARSQYSATFANHAPTLAFTWAAKKLAQGLCVFKKQKHMNGYSYVFVLISRCSVSRIYSRVGNENVVFSFFLFSIILFPPEHQNRQGTSAENLNN